MMLAVEAYLRFLASCDQSGVEWWVGPDVGSLVCCEEWGGQRA